MDQALTTQDWIDMFRMHQLSNGISDKTDHYPIWLKLNDDNKRLIWKSFHFGNVWLDEPDLVSIVGYNWSGNEGLELLEKIKQCTEVVDVGGAS